MEIHMTAPQTQLDVDARRAKALTEIGKRLAEIQVQAVKSQNALIVAARAIANGDEGAGTHGALLEHVEKMIAEPDSKLSQCQADFQQFLKDAAAHNWAAAGGAFNAHVHCLRTLSPIPF
jgi:hypothetical protein